MILVGGPFVFMYNRADLFRKQKALTISLPFLVLPLVTQSKEGFLEESLDEALKKV